MKTFDPVISVFRNHETRLKAIGYSVLLFLLFGFGVALIPNPIFVRMIPSTLLDYFFLTTTSLLGGIYFALPDKKACTPDKTVLGGSLLGFLSFGCPTCNKLLFFMLGPVFLFSVFDPLRPLIGLLSLVVLGYAINKKAEGTI